MKHDYQFHINGLKGIKPYLQQLMLTTNYEGMGETDAKEIGETLDLAIEALEKQMPKKPKIIDYARPYYDRGGAIIDGEMYVKCHCPVCEILLFDVEYTCFEDFKETDEFCMSCGQALDWSDTE